MEKSIESALKTLVINDDGSIFVEPVCKYFGINFKSQKRRFLEDPILQSEGTKKYHELAFGDKRLRLCVGRRGFIRWIQLINAEIVHPHLQKLFIEYQIAIFNYLYNGNETKINQLEDIRTYAININNALNIRDQILDYITEQKRHRDLCLSYEPAEWAKIKPTLIEEKRLPEIAEDIKAIANELPNDVDELNRLKKNYQSAISKYKCLLIYQRKMSQPVENPMPEGYKKELLKLRTKEREAEIEKINQKLVDIYKSKSPVALER